MVFSRWQASRNFDQTYVIIPFNRTTKTTPDMVAEFFFTCTYPCTFKTTSFSSFSFRQPNPSIVPEISSDKCAVFVFRIWKWF